MTAFGMVIDLARCVACQSCTVACQAENNIPFAEPDQDALGRSIFWNEVLTEFDEHEDDYPHIQAEFIPRPCMHCRHPQCIKVCPVGATYQNEDGTVGQVYGRCIGCRYCTVACPYTVRYFNWYRPKWPKLMISYLNPDVSVRPRGVVEKCVYCPQRVQKAKDEARAEDRPLRDEDLRKLTACAQTCVADAITFGDYDDPESTISKLARSPRAFQLLEDLGTEPKTIYLAEEHAE